MKKLVEVSPVVEALVITAEVALMFCAKRLRNLFVLDPRERVISEEGRSEPVVVSVLAADR